ncbi:MAG: hypothetical protein GXP09_09270 [Gammaproteobacteria bacterium]|nr:hypothetical protein [Gammaproteobacteria bacterium]
MNKHIISPALVLMVWSLYHPVAFSATQNLFKKNTCSFSRIENQAQLDKVLHCVKSRKQDRYFDVHWALSNLGNAPKHLNLRFNRLINALHHPMKVQTAANYINVIATHLPKGGAAELLRYLKQDMIDRESASALTTLLRYNDPSAWRKARKIVEQIYRDQQINDGMYMYAKGKLDPAIRDPDHQAEQNKKAKLRAAFLKESDQVRKEKRRIDRIKKTDPEQYIQRSLAEISRMQKIAEKYSSLQPGPVVGFRGDLLIRQKRLAAYAGARGRESTSIQIYESMGGWKADLEIADLKRKYGDVKMAIAYYDKVLKALDKPESSESRGEQTGAKQIREWLEHEVAYLKTGKTQPIKISRDKLGMFWASMYLNVYATEPSPLIKPLQKIHKGIEIERNRAHIRKYLFSLPKSPTNIAINTPYIAALANKKDVTQFVSLNDPAGYWEAYLYAFTLQIQQRQQHDKKDEVAERYGKLLRSPSGKPSALLQAAQEYTKYHPISFPTRDKRMGTPQGTWAVLMEGLKTGNRELALDCMTIKLKQKLGPQIKSMTKVQMNAFSESFTAFKLSASFGGFREAIVTRTSSDGRKLAGMVYFTRDGSDWLIQEM